METDGNGMLAAVPGEYISRGSACLPAAGDCQGQKLAATIDTTELWHGLVRIRYASTRVRHGRQSHWVWVAVHAERVSG